MNQDLGRSQPGITFSSINSSLSAGNDISLSFQSNVTVNNLNPEPSILTRLKTALNPVTSASYNSYEAKQRSECFPNTRVQVLNDIEAWIHRQSHEPQIYILDGVAGIGKSTVAQTISNRAAALGLLGASFFFARDEDLRKIARYFFPTVAYQLGCHDGQFAARIHHSLDQNPDAPAKLLYQQLLLLLLGPLQDVLVQRTRPTLIVMDALDECEAESAEELLSLLGQHIHQVKGLKILVTMRPEAHLREVLAQDKNHEMFRLHEIEDSIVHSDIQLYLESRLSVEEVRKASRNRGNPWQPTANDLEMLCGICGTLFVVAATATRFILDRKRLNPEKQFARLIDGFSTPRLTSSSFTNVLDETYVSIILAAQSDPEEDDEDWFKDFNRVLGALIALLDPLPCNTLASLLDTNPEDIEATLSQLHSLIAPTGSGDTMTFRIHHKSFPDFITNRERIQQVLHPWKSSTRPGLDFLLWIDMNDQHLHLAKACFRIMDRDLKWNMAGIKKEDWYLDKKDVPHVVAQIIPRDLAYATLHWASHLKSACRLSKDSVLQKHLDTWASRHILAWMEVMVILDQVNGIYGILQDAIESATCIADVAWEDQVTTQELLSDAYRFMQQGHEVMRLSPMHIYRSCLPFIPVETPLYQAYGIMDMLNIGLTRSNRWGPLLATLIGHSRAVISVTFSTNRSQLASGSYDNTVQLWNAKTGAHIRTLTGHSKLVNSIAFSNDGSRLASGSNDRTIRLWNATTGVHICTMTGHSGQVNSVAFSSDGIRLVSRSGDGSVRLWDGNTGAHICTLTGHSRQVNSVAFSGDDCLLASGSSDRTIRLWDAKTGAYVRTLTGHSGWVNSVAFSSDGCRLASGANDRTVRLWDAASGAHISTLRGHSDWVYSVAFSVDSSRLASRSSDTTIKLWDGRSGKLISTLTGHTDWINSVAFSNDGCQLASGSSDTTIRLWEAKTGAHIRTLTGHSRLVNSVAFSSDGSRLASGSNDRTIRFWDAGSNISNYTGHSGSVCSIAFSGVRSLLASASSDGTVQVWDTETQTHITTLTGHLDSVNAVAFSTNGCQLASGSSDKTIRLWNAGERIHEFTLTGHSGWVNSVAFSGDGCQLASGSRDRTIRIWDISAEEVQHISTLSGHVDWVLSVVFSRDGSRLASSSSDKTIKVWHTTKGYCVSTLTGHSDWVSSVTFSDDRLASISGDNTIRFWDATTAAHICTATAALNVSIRSFVLLKHNSQLVDQIIRPNYLRPQHKVTYPAYLLLLVQRQESPLITGIMIGKLPLEVQGDLKCEFFPVCWFPPDMEVATLSVSHLGSQLAVGCENGRVMLLDISADCLDIH